MSVRFSGDRAWQEAMRLFAGNREVLLALAGVFVLLPLLLVAIPLSGLQAQMAAVMPHFQPGSPPSMEALQPLLAIYARLAPYLLVIALLQAIGGLAMLALLGDETRPTVRQALGTALASLLPLIGASLLFFVGLVIVMIIGGLALSLVGALAALVGLKWLATLLMIVGFVAFFVAYVVALIRVMVLLSAVVVIGRERRPLRALTTAWHLTRGNAARLFGFYVLLGIACLVIVLVLTMALGALVTLVAGKGETAQLVTALISGVISAVTTAVFVAIRVAVYRQLNVADAGQISV